MDWRALALVGSSTIVVAACSDDGLPQNSATDAQSSATSSTGAEETLPATSISGSASATMTGGTDSTSMGETATNTMSSTASSTDPDAGSTGEPADSSGGSTSGTDLTGSTGSGSTGSGSTGSTSGAESTGTTGGVGETFDVSFCRLQFPLTINDSAGSLVTMYGRFYAEGLTDIDEFNNPHENVHGYVGYGADGSDPALGGWTWFEATPNPGWDGTVFGEPNNDEYWYDMTIPAAGVYDFAFRWTGDDGESFAYCDGDNAGSSDGYEIDQAGDMTAT